MMTKTVFGIAALVVSSVVVGCAPEPTLSEERGSSTSNVLSSKEKRRIVSEQCPTASDSVRLAYLITLSRAADADGEAYWVDKIESGEATRIGVLRSLIGSAEFASKNAVLSNEGFVEVMYSHLLRREPEAEGKAFWLGALERGSSRAEVALSMTRTPEFTDFEENPFAACFFE